MTKSILLADDSVTIQKVVELTFMDEDFAVSAVSSGAEAIARLGESKPDVVIADVHMPGATGFEVCRRSKELYPAVPVLLLVGTFESFDADEAMRCGADGHLKKPFDSQELMRRVRELASTPSRSLPVPSAAAEIAPEPHAFDDIYAAPMAASTTPTPAAPPIDDLWEPLPDEPSAMPAALESPEEPMELLSVEEFPPLQAAPEPVAETRFVPFASAPEAPSTLAPTASMRVESVGEASASVSVANLSDADVDRIARRMLELLGDKPVRDVAWEVVPDLAEVLLRNRIRELEASID